MTALPPEVGRPPEPFGVGGFEIGYVTDDGLEHRVSLSQAWATPFDSSSPIRRFTSHKGQRHLSGLWWSATTGGCTSRGAVTASCWCRKGSTYSSSALADGGADHRTLPAGSCPVELSNGWLWRRQVAQHKAGSREVAAVCCWTG